MGAISRMGIKVLMAMYVDLCIPANSTDFIVSISESLASTEQYLTLEFLNECLVGFNKSSELMRQLCLAYMAPWLRNMALFSRATPDDNNKNLAKTKDILRLLIELTVTRSDVSILKHKAVVYIGTNSG